MFVALFMKYIQSITYPIKNIQTVNYKEILIKENTYVHM